MDGQAIVHPTGSLSSPMHPAIYLSDAIVREIPIPGKRCQKTGIIIL